MSRGPMVGAGKWAVVVTRAGGRCECTGQCGRSHADRRRKAPPPNPRCPHEDTETSPLHAIPRMGEQGVEAMRLEPAQMLAVCDDCHKGHEARRRRQERQNAAQQPGKGTPLFTFEEATVSP